MSTLRTTRRLAAITALAGLAVTSCETLEEAVEVEPRVLARDIPRYPAQPEFDFARKEVIVHRACPVFESGAGFRTSAPRVWVKGSPRFRRAYIDASSPVSLEPPYYTAVLDAQREEVEVVFEDDRGAQERVPLDLASGPDLNDAQRDFGLIAFGGFQPFEVREGSARVSRGAGEGADSRLADLREALARAARGELDDDSVPPSLMFGTGDQIYAEPAYHSYGDDPDGHPLSAWSVGVRPTPRVSAERFDEFMDETYRNFWSFDHLDAAFRHVPAVLTWDDHEVRDGWGSQGDEHVFRDTYYATARRAYIEHQVLHGTLPRGSIPSTLDGSLHQSFVLHGVDVFTLDLRSARDVSVPRLLGDDQWMALEDWFRALDPDRSPYYVLVSSIPIFVRVSARAHLLAHFGPEIRDDLLDAWDSPANESEWERLVGLVHEASERGMRAVILSGDYHSASVTRVVSSPTDSEDETVVAYEIISSGLAHRGTSGWKNALRRKGLIFGAPIEVDGGELRTETVMSAGYPNFAVLERVAGDWRAVIVQAGEDAVRHRRLTLEWDASRASELDEVVELDD